MNRLHLLWIVLCVLCAACADGEPPTLSWAAGDPSAPVSVVQPLRVQASEPLDPERTATVTLTDAFGDPVQGTASYDEETHVITFDPARALAWKAEYTLRIEPVRDVAGNASGPFVQVVRTFRNRPVSRLNYGVAVLSFERYTHDAEGAATRTEYFGEPGPDGMWTTQDDVLTRVTLYENGSGETTSWDISGPGADATWETADDELANRVRTVFDDQGRVVRNEYLGRGADGSLGTTDDEPTRWTERTWRGGDMLTQIEHDSPGADGQWLTADDSVRLADAMEYDQHHRRTVRAMSVAPGPDGQWLTSDDVLERVEQVTFAVDGTSARVRGVEAGADGRLGTSDDGLSSLAVRTFDEHGRLLQEDGLRAGSDGVLDTADDVVGTRLLVEHGAHDNVTMQVHYSGPGGDGVWATADDAVGNVTTFDPDR